MASATVRAVRTRARNWTGALAKRLGERAGIDIARHHPPGPRRAALIRRHGIEMVLDVGANRGQYARDLRAYGYGGEIVSFEPSSGAFSVLSTLAADDAHWHARREAVGDHDALITLGEADNFSSVLPAAERLTELFPEARPRRTETVRARRLDDAGLALPRGCTTLLKIDVQGYELPVWEGAEGILPHVAIVETELSLVPLYDGQALLADLVGRIELAGLQLRWLEPVLRDRTTGAYLQFDGVFARP